MSQAGIINTQSGPVPPSVATSYVTNSGTAVPAANILNVLGSSGASTSGSGNTITITSTDTFSYTRTAINYQVLNTDAIIGISSTASARTITMPNSGLVTGKVWTIKDESGLSAINNITINGNGVNIDGSSTYVINTDYGSASLYYNGTQFYLI